MKIYINTRSSMSMVQRKFVPVSADTGHFMAMRNTIGTTHYPVAEVKVELDGPFYQEKMAVSKGLEDVLLGLDVNIWLHLVKVRKKEEVNRIKRLTEEEEKEETYMYAVSSKAQGEQQLEQKNQQNGKGVEEEEENRKNLSLWEQFVLMTLCLLLNEKSEQYKSAAQQREQKKTQGKDPLAQNLLSREKLFAKQEEDSVIQQWKTEEEPSNKTEIVEALCRHWRSTESLDEKRIQLVLPKKYQTVVLRS